VTAMTRRSTLSTSEVEAHIAAVDHFLNSRKSPVDGAGALLASKEASGLPEGFRKHSVLQVRGDRLLVWSSLLFVALTSSLGCTLIGFVLYRRFFV